MPPVAAGYLLNYFFEIGPLVGGETITQGEIRHWQGNVGVTLRPWECRVLRNLSREYLAESRRAQQFNAKAPWKPEAHKPLVSDTQNAIRALANR